MKSLLLPFLLLFPSTWAEVTIYTTPQPQGPTTASIIDPAVPTNLAAYNTLVLTPPALPNPMPPLTFAIQLQQGTPAGASQPMKANLMGFSIELSIANQLLGRNSSLLNVPFLNLLENIRARAGVGPVVRVGGNTQEGAKLYPDFYPSYQVINKTLEATVNNPTATPQTNFSDDLLTLMLKISQLVHVQWGFGLPFGDATNTTGIAAISQYVDSVLGDWLFGLQLGNEPDMYPVDERHRLTGYNIPDFMNEWGAAIAAMNQDNVPEPLLLGPSICCGQVGFDVPDILSNNFIGGFMQQLKVVSVQHYPSNNCNITGYPPPAPQAIFPSYLGHWAAINMATPYIPISQAAQAAGKPMVMYEINTASCAGFPGVSDSFGAGLWALDVSLQLAVANFSNAMFHIGGQSASYNPFTPPPSNISKTHQWSVGPIYYASLASAEFLASSNNNSQIVDLAANGNNTYTPAYAVYENGVPKKVGIFNFMDSSQGPADITVNVGIANGGTPQSVKVRYLTATSVSSKYNVTWGGLSAGGQLASDGILRGDDGTVTIQCDPNNGCPIPVKAPQFALVFLDGDQDAAYQTSTMTETFATTVGRKINTATVAQAVLQTSNGMGGPDNSIDTLGSTSREKANAGWSLKGEGRGWFGTLLAVFGGLVGVVGV